ncbi:YebC/PmpR family DNA-binding transcriptional regulator [bacterium (Candidatus Moisslbacteria) CG12_big_fil_rev_8_21_14_0_65_36_11]|nr:YebC/PmpR family DNA-binding transcriptional regulator [Candidatus Kuenenbacteria bacterium]OIP76302.1 MAG: hypothetical protein AUK09_02440 [Parcubacteria group bacterium CG2_30_36_38]PIV45929.1 MAG: YebC/PmpR family DNA-binding transcriptional regulator [bacterium (Candidatus Moisslbacteria) CG02_land_8_20_14_3_00_36_53]PIW68038.1 MAG: YebC/PmpR family DNA-binding transcriptional regulator [bacterium (Candidatus Moisslbacteria) CG12_big_fil_rev_8_21_14_0_65_36_11]PIZ90189.1 MAG: YebC/PmpR 
MSGHSKWAKLKHFKGALDVKKSSLFTKLGHLITVAARQGGGSPETNFKLRIAIEQANKANIPKENVERAIKRGLGEGEKMQIEEATYEAFGPGGAAIVVEALTDNKNRTTADLRRIFNKYEGTLGGQNSILWMFEKKGTLRIAEAKKIENKEELELGLIDAGAKDIKEEGEEIAIYTQPEKLQEVKEFLESKGVVPDYAEIEWFAKNYVKISEEDQKKIDAIFAELDEDPDVNDYYTNIIPSNF